MYYQTQPYYVEQILHNWYQEPKDTAYMMIRKYGWPNEATLSRLIWYGNGSWKRTIIFRDPVPHYFPTPHWDYLEQTIDYRVPVNLFDEVAKFDGSVYLDRTKGEASAKCHNEPMNLLTLNLLNDIVTKKRDIDNARKFYAETAKNFKFHQTSSPYIEKLLFPSQTNTSDPDLALF